MQNKKFLIGALVAIALVVGGIAYFGTAGNQQASVGNLLARASTSKPVVKPVFDDNTGAPTSNTAKTGSGKPSVDTSSSVKTVAPTTTSQFLDLTTLKGSTGTGQNVVTKQTIIRDVASVFGKKLSTATPISEKKKQVSYYQAGEYCLIYYGGHLIGGGSFMCP